MKKTVPHMRSLALSACLMIAMLQGCTDENIVNEIVDPDAIVGTLTNRSDLDPVTLEASLLRAGANARTHVKVGSSIQAAVEQASPGSVIVVEPGTYLESVTIGKPNITLIGKPGRAGGEGVIIQNPGGLANGVSVTADGDGVRLFNFTVRGFDRNGVFMSGVEKFALVRLTAEDNGDYGLFPTRSSQGVMMHCRASGHADAGLYVGQSTQVRIIHNTVYENVIGIEASNSSFIELSHNTAEDNTIGILSVLLPPSPFRSVLDSSDMLITHNTIRDNNHPNFADEGSLPSFVPPGSGILVVGVDRTVVEKNIVTGNDWVGIGLGSTATFGLLAGIPDVGLPDPDPDDVVIRRNTLEGNGAEPPPPPFPLPGVDLLWDGTGTGNCWEKNDYASSFPPSLPICNAGV